MAAYPQSVAYTRVFYAYLTSDHVSAATTKTITMQVSKAGGAFGAAGGTITEIANGAYKIVLTTTDTNTIGDLTFWGTATGTDDIKFVDQVTDPAKGLGAPSNLDAAITSRMATYTQPTGFLAATFPGSVASPTNITAGTITTVTNLTNAPTAGDLTATMKASVTTAATAATPTAAAVTGAVGSVTGAVGSVTGAVGSVTGAVGSVTGLTASDVGAIKTQTDKLTFTVANQVDVNVLDWKSATAPAMTGDAFARIGVAGVGLTNLGDTRIASLDAAVSTRMATFTLPTNFSSLGISAGGKINGVVLTDTLTTYTGNTPQTGDVFATANAEPTSVIAANASLAAKIGWITAQSLNKITQTATTMTMRNNADSGTIATSPTSDDGTTAIRGVFA